MIKYLRSLLKKLFYLPSPKELGWSKHDALGSRKLTPDQSGPTWEDWEAFTKKAYPVAYFMTHTLIDFFLPLSWWYRNVKEYLRCKLLPWKYDYYKINLAGNDPLDLDTYGYLDPCERMRKAVWYCLCQYVEKDKPEDPASYLTPEELILEHNKAQIETYYEAMFLYNWWKVARIQLSAKRQAFYTEMDSVRKLGDKKKLGEMKAIWLDKWLNFELKEEEMFLRVCKIRPYLWT
jgi:hypothetical protein